MKELIFKVEFKSNIVLPSTSNTEGNIEQLDFIPGSNFLGMVAKNYDKFSNSFDVFHSGKIRFGDGHILKDDKPTYKIPYSYFHKKLESKPIYNHHRLEDEDFKPLEQGGLGQLKQLRRGYIAKDKEEVFVNYVYSQKSAYNKTTRTSKEGYMYGYKALKKDSFWQFVVQVDGVSVADKKLIVDTLEASSRLGKSKSAEYGDVEITFIKEQELEEDTLKYDGEVLLYANSRLALVDEYGNPTYDLEYLDDEVKGKINYDKSQIRTSTFSPYNSAMKTKSYERIVINKGSVIVLKDISSSTLERIKKGVGAYWSEGFGEIIVNPSFLMDRKLNLEKECNKENPKDKREKITKNFEDNTIKFLVNRHNVNIDTLEILNDVAKFVTKNKKNTFKNIKSSQWGNVRSIASANQDDFIQKIEEYISEGTKKWDSSQVTVLMDSIKYHKINKQQFSKLLAMKMRGKND